MRPQKASHIGLLDAKFIFGVTAPVLIRSKKTPWVAQIAIHSRPKCRIYSNAAGASPGQHTIPNAILLSQAGNVKSNCANFDLETQKTLSLSPNGFFAGARKISPDMVEWG